MLLLWVLLLCAGFLRSGADQPGGGSELPFCKICTCEDNKVTCDNYIGEKLFDSTNWMNQTSVSYPYQSLVIRNNPIINLNSKFPASNITYLSLGNNSIVNISNNIFSQLQNMEVLDLSYNNIEIIDPEAFNGLYLEGDVYPLRSLKKLHMNHNRINTLNGNVFEHTSRIEILTLSHNPLKILDKQTIIAITSLLYLKELDLSHTELSSLPDYFMHTPRYITFLDLSGNSFDSIPKTLGESHSLTTLYFNNNPIVNLTSENGFPNISTLTQLHMSNMPNLMNIGKGAFSKLQNLEELYLFNNIELSNIHKAALSLKQDDSDYSTWPPLKKLYLQNNKLASIDMIFLLSWKNLNELDMTGNSWTCECENQWMIDELMPIYLQINSDGAKTMKCAAPIEMATFTFYDIYKKQSAMRCLDRYGNRPERDGVMLVGILAGVLITIPLVLFIIYSYQRHWFGLFDSSPASFSRQFYKRTVSNDEYF